MFVSGPQLWVFVDLALTGPLPGRGVFSCVRIWQEVGVGRRSRAQVESKRRFSTVCTMKQMVSWLPGAKVAFRSPTLVGWQVNAWPQLAVHLQNKPLCHPLEADFWDKVRLIKLGVSCKGILGGGGVKPAAQMSRAGVSSEETWSRESCERTSCGGVVGG